MQQKGRRSSVSMNRRSARTSTGSSEGPHSDTLNSLLDAEADAIGQAGRHERSPERLDEVLGVCEGGREDGESRSSFLRHLKERGLGGVRLATSDKSLGLLETLPHFFPEARWQRCVVPFYRNGYSAVPRGKAREVALMLEAIHNQEDLPAPPGKRPRPSSKSSRP